MASAKNHETPPTPMQQRLAAEALGAEARADLARRRARAAKAAWKKARKAFKEAKKTAKLAHKAVAAARAPQLPAAAAKTKTKTTTKTAVKSVPPPKSNVVRKPRAAGAMPTAADVARTVIKRLAAKRQAESRRNAPGAAMPKPATVRAQALLSEPGVPPAAPQAAPAAIAGDSVAIGRKP